MDGAAGTASRSEFPVEVVRAERRRVVLLAVGSLAFVVAAGNLALRGDEGDLVAGIATLVVFGSFLVISLVFLIRPPIIVFFGPDGIAVPTGLRRRRAPMIPWSAIEAVRIYRLEVAPLAQGCARSDSFRRTRKIGSGPQVVRGESAGG